MATTKEGIDMQIKPFIRKGLWKLYTKIIEDAQTKETKGDPDQVNEIRELLEYCTDPYPFEAMSFSSQLLLKLCRLKIISKDYLLRKLLTVAAMNKDLVCAVSSIFKLITIEINEQLETSGKYTCPYGIRSPPHPLITVFQQRHDSCHAIANEIQSLFLIEDSYSRTAEFAVAALRPFFSFLMLNQDHGERSVEVFLLYSTLTQCMSKMQDLGLQDISTDIATFLLELISHRKATRMQIYDNVTFTTQLAYCLLRFPATHEVEVIATEIGYHVMSQCHKLLQMSLDISVHLNLLQKIFIKYPKGFLSDEFVYLLALLLYRSPSFYKECILKLAIHVLPCYTLSCEATSQFLVLKAFFLPLIIIMSNYIDEEGERMVQKLTVNIFKNIEIHLAACKGSKERDPQELLVSPRLPLEFILAKHHCALLHEISRSKASATAFLKALEVTTSRSDSILLVLSTLFVRPADCEVLKDTLALVSLLGKNDATVALEFLPLILHAANCSMSSDMTLQILEKLPSLAVNKHVLPPVLKVVTMLGHCESLLPFSIRLTTELWKIQPRIFPYLFELLSKKMQVDFDELCIAKAASILEICKLRPVQYGPDVIGLISAIFGDFANGASGTSAEVTETAVYLGLEALRSLCEAEVSDLPTAWKIVSSRILPCTSDVILKGILNLLSVCPTILGSSAIETELKIYSCEYIWKNVGHENPHISSVASACLANFSTEEFIVEILPEKVREHAFDFLMRKYTIKKREGPNNYDPRKELIPASTYAYLLQDLKSEASIGCSRLLSKILREEVELLPRNISRANAAQRQDSRHDKFIDSIPDCLKSFYVKSSNTALMPAVAASLLSCYKSVIIVGKREEHGKRHLIADATTNRDMLDNLLTQVSVEPSDWQQSMTAQRAWSRFMGRVFDATVEGRKANLYLLFDKGHITSQEDLHHQIASAYYWARDELTAQLMKASIESPTMQGNSVLGLAGLANAIATKSEPPAGGCDASMQFSSKKNWLGKVADTIMTVLDGNFKPTGRPFRWCQRISSHKSTASSLLSRACAAVALPGIAVTLIAVDLERIQQICHLLASRMPGQEKAGTSSIIQFNAAIGLGMLVAGLQQEKFSDIFGQDGYVLITKAKGALESAVYNEELQNREGAFFGYGTALGALFTETLKDFRLHASMAYARFNEAVKSLNATSVIPLKEEGNFFALGAATIGGFRAAAISTETALKAFNVVKDACKANRKSYTLHAAYGSLLHGLLSSGLSQLKDAFEDSIDSWLKAAADVNEEISERVAAIHGLLTAFGALTFLFQLEDSGVFDPVLKNKLSIVIKTMEEIIEANDDAEASSHACKLLGFLYMGHQGASSHNSLPSTYNYLAESSILRTLFNCLLEAGKSGPSGNLPASAVNAILLSLIASTDVRLPPVNWPQVLNSFMKLGFGTETRRLCLKFAIRILSTCPTLPAWLLSWLNPPVFLSLELTCKREVFDNIDTIVANIPLNKLEIVIDDMMLKTFKNEDGCLDERLLVLGALKSLSKVVNPVQSSLLLTRNVLIKICGDESVLENEDIIQGIASILFCLPTELKDIVMDSLKTANLVVCMESAMVRYFRSSLRSLARSFGLLASDPTCLSDQSLVSLKYALQCHFLNSSSPKDHEAEVFWFVEQMDRIRSFSVNKMNSQFNTWLGVLSSTVSIWSSSGFHCALMDARINTLLDSACLDLFGAHLSYLLETPKWQHLKEKVLNWLIELAESRQRNFDKADGSANLIKGSLLCILQSETRIPHDVWLKSVEILLR